MGGANKRASEIDDMTRMNKDDILRTMEANGLWMIIVAMNCKTQTCTSYSDT